MRRMYWAAAALVLAAAGSAQASYTSFGSSGEPSLYSIFSSNYGAPSGGFTQTDFETSPATSRTFGTYTFTRVNDSGGSTPTDIHSLVAPSTNDNEFMDGTTSVKFTVKYAGNTNTLGWVNHDATHLVPAPVALGPVTAGNFNPILGDSPAGTSTTVMLSGDFQLALRSSGTYWGSNSGTNSDSSDHLMTWFVSDSASGRKFFVIGWEDLPIGGGADRDYNDWVGELQVVPLPAAAWAGISSLAGVAGFGIIRRRRLRAS